MKNFEFQLFVKLLIKHDLTLHQTALFSLFVRLKYVEVIQLYDYNIFQYFKKMFFCDFKTCFENLTEKAQIQSAIDFKIPKM